MYLERMKRLNLIPNFWCSYEYFKRAGWVIYSNSYNMYSLLTDQDEKENSNMFHVLDEEGYNMLPPLSPLGGGGKNTPYWSGFCLEDYDGDVLDLNYIYNPSDFLDLRGKRWRAFRKNIEKWPANNPVHEYRHIMECERYQMTDVFLEWLSLRPKDEEIYDSKTILSYIKDSSGCRGLFREDELVGFTIRDENWMFINFRYCFSKSEPFLNEYIRYRFYTSVEILESGKLVNDGGVLDSRQLEFFKDRLNPVTIYSVPTKGGY